jgi:nucleotide-binding universal stress UspA family protein
MFERILLAVDGSENALHAAKAAGDLARAVKSKELRIVVAYDPVPVYLGEPNLDHAITARMQESQGILQRAQEAVGKIAVEIHTELIEGPVAEAILEVASTRQSDVIVMGSRGRGRLVGALLGSNSQKVVSHASCPVLIVR